MDGLTISNANKMLSLDRVTTGADSSELRPLPSVGGAKSDGDSFLTTLRDAVNQVNDMQKQADIKSNELATGKSTNVAEVMIAMEKADIALRTLVQVRNKIIDAYQEVMKMQV